jgi:hypothetical protein
MAGMLGRLRRTTRVDVGLALTFSGLAYLVWALVAGISRSVIQEMIRSTARVRTLPESTRVVKVLFVNSGIALDLLGLAWLAMSLFLVARSSRQRMSISWAWVSAIGQSLIAAMGAVLVGWAAYQPHILRIPTGSASGPIFERVTALSLPVTVALAVAVWVTFLVWLLKEQAKMGRRGPVPRDGLRTNR